MYVRECVYARCKMYVYLLHVHVCVRESIRINMHWYFTCSDRHVSPLFLSLCFHLLAVFGLNVCVCTGCTFCLIMCMYVDHQNRTEQVTQSNSTTKSLESQAFYCGILAYDCVFVCSQVRMTFYAHRCVCMCMCVCDLSQWNSTCTSVCVMCMYVQVILYSFHLNIHFEPNVMQNLW